MIDIFRDKNSLRISPSIVVFTVFFLLGLYFLYYVRSIVALLFLAFMIMVALNPAVTGLQRRLRLPRVVSTLLVYVVVIAAISGLVALVIPPLSHELYELFRNLNVPPFLQNEINNFRFTISEVGSLADRIGTSVGMVYSIVTSTFSGIITFFTLIVMSFYMMMDRPNLHKKISWFTHDERYLEKTRLFLDSLESQLGGWVRGQVILMLTIGVLTYVGLSLIGVPYALPLAILAGFLEILPNLGPTIAALPAIVFAYLGMGPVMAGVTALFYIVVQQLENNIIVPKIMRDNADVNPLVAIVVILVGLELAGVLGALLAVPSYIVIRTVYATWFRSLAD